MDSGRRFRRHRRIYHGRGRKRFYWHLERPQAQGIHGHLEYVYTASDIVRRHLGNDYQRAAPLCSHDGANRHSSDRRLPARQRNDRTHRIAQRDCSGGWRANFGGTFTTIVLRQAGDQVTGQLNANSAEFGVITDGNVVGNTLSFKIMRPAKMPNGLYRSYRYAGNGEVVMDEGGKSFTGKVLGTATSGTFLAK